MLEIIYHSPIRKDIIKPPKTYLDTDTKLIMISYDDEFWCNGANSYLKEALQIFQKKLKENKIQVKGKGQNIHHYPIDQSWT